MKRNLMLITLLLLAASGFTQTRKIYLNSKGKTTDSLNAKFYIIEEKINDTTFNAAKYNEAGELLLKGIFKDDQLAVRNGYFYEYAAYHSFNNPTVRGKIFLAREGSYANGMKSGLWISYNDLHQKVQEDSYSKDVPDGPYKFYSSDGKEVIQDGSYFKGKRDGTWNKYDYGNDKPTYTEIYERGKLIKSISHTYVAKAAKGLDDYLAESLGSSFDRLKDMGLIAKLSLNETGKVDSVSTDQELPASALSAIIKAFLNGPTFKPAFRDDKPIKSVYIYNFKYGSSLHQSLPQ